MKRKRYSPEQIIAMLREAEVKIAQGMAVGEVSRQLGIPFSNDNRFVLQSKVFSALLFDNIINYKYSS